MTSSIIYKSWSKCSQRTSANTACGKNFGLNSIAEKLVLCSGQADSQLSASFSPQHPFIYTLNSSPGLEKKTIFPDGDLLQYLVSWCLCMCF